MGTYSKAERRNPAEMGEPNSSGHALIGMASAVAQDGQAAGRDGRKGRAGPAHMGGPFMAFMYRFFRTFLFHVMWPLERVLWCARWAVWTGRVTLSVTSCDPLSWRVYRARHEGCLHTRLPLHTDRDDLWPGQLVKPYGSPWRAWRRSGAHPHAVCCVCCVRTASASTETRNASNCLTISFISLTCL